MCLFFINLFHDTKKPCYIEEVIKLLKFKNYFKNWAR